MQDQWTHEEPRRAGGQDRPAVDPPVRPSYLAAMKTSEADILIVPGLMNSDEDHWQSRWEARLPTARRVVQDDWRVPDRDAWSARIAEAVREATRPVILIAHSLGVVAVAHAAPQLPDGAVRGAFLVGFPDVEDLSIAPQVVASFAPIPCDPLPFPSVLVASQNDPYATIARAKHFAKAWGADFVDAGESGHLNAASGHGPWPEGLMRFAEFMRHL